jgi:hypothetical protein
MAGDESRSRREEFERRVLALVRSRLDRMDEHDPGWQITEFVITWEYFRPPDEDEKVSAWAGGPFPGWHRYTWTVGSSTQNWVDEVLLKDALDGVRDKRQSETADDVYSSGYAAGDSDDASDHWDHDDAGADDADAGSS